MCVTVGSDANKKLCFSGKVLEPLDIKCVPFSHRVKHAFGVRCLQQGSAKGAAKCQEKKSLGRMHTLQKLKNQMLGISPLQQVQEIRPDGHLH